MMKLWLVSEMQSINKEDLIEEDTGKGGFIFINQKKKEVILLNTPKNTN